MKREDLELARRKEIGSARGRTKLVILPSRPNPELEGGEAIGPTGFYTDATQELYEENKTQAIAWYLCSDVAAHDRADHVIHPTQMP